MNQTRASHARRRQQPAPAPLCPLCGVRERAYDSEPPLRGDDSDYYLYCDTCSSLCGFGEHTHTYYGSPAQVAAGTVKAGHSWRTTLALLPIMKDGEHIGARCSEFALCGWEHEFTPEERAACPTHSKVRPVAVGRCANWQEHLAERGEIDAQGGITEYGQREVRRRIDASNWDPGHYIDPHAHA